MQIEYVNSKIRKLCSDPERYGRGVYPLPILKKLQEVLIIIAHIESCQDFFKSVHLRFLFERLTNSGGLMSIRLDRKYRLTFYDMDYDEKKDFIKIVGVTIKEVSKHYGD